MALVETRRGLLYGFSAYILWGIFPLYFALLSRSGAIEIVAYRLVFSLLFCLLLIAVVRKMQVYLSLLTDRRAFLTLTLAGVLVTANWTIFVWGVNNGHALDASLGYFINPLFSAFLGRVIYREHMRPMQWFAFGIGLISVVVLTVLYGSIPWIALALAFSFGTYGAVKKSLGTSVDALCGLAIETTVLSVAALAFLIYLSASGVATVTYPSSYALLLTLCGPITAIPLLLFAGATSRLPLSTIGMIQYINPIIQFLLAWLILDEPMPSARWVGFIIIWFAVAFFVVDAVLHRSRFRIDRAVTS